MNRTPYKLKVPALFGGDEAHPTTALKLTQIVLPKEQPRRYFDPEKMASLIVSVKTHGVLEPLLVRPLIEGKYELVAGERRYRAAREVGLEEVPVVVRELDNDQAVQLSLIENLLREDLNPVEETEGILQLLSIQLSCDKEAAISLLYRLDNEAKEKVTHNVVGNEERATIETVFSELGFISRESFVSHRLPLLKLPEDVLQVLRQGKIEYTKALAIARIKNAEQREELLKSACLESLSLTQIKERIAALRKIDRPQASANLKSQATQVFTDLKKSKIWADPSKQERIEKILAEIKDLLSD